MQPSKLRISFYFCGVTYERIDRTASCNPGFRHYDNAEEVISVRILARRLSVKSTSKSQT